MKRIFTFLTALLLVGVVNAQLKLYVSPRVEMPAAARGVQKSTITPAANQHWWGYVTTDTRANSVGVQKADTYHAAIFIPGDHAVAGGKSICGVRFSLTAPHATATKVWVASQLPTTIDASTTLQCVDVPDADLGTRVEVALPSPCQIPASGVYVGYSFTITSVSSDADNYPVAFAEDAEPNTLLLRTSSAVPSWSDLYSNDFGKLLLKVLLEGDFLENAATPSDLGNVYLTVGETGTAKVTVTNSGSEPLTNFDYTITTDGVESAPQHAELKNPVAFAAKGEAEISIPAEGEQSMKEKVLTITKVNGADNQASKTTANFTLYSLSEIVDRNVLVEEFTGTGCGYCPRGLVGMEKLRATFGDRFIGVGIHQYNSNDAMYINPNSYARLNFQGAPSCYLDRKYELDPYYGNSSDICDDFRAEMAVPAMANLQVAGQWNANESQVTARAMVNPLFADQNYSVEFVLIADGLTGSGSGWNQANYYYQYSSSQLPDDLSQFGNGGANGSSSVTGWVFNDVAINSSYVSGSNQAPGFQSPAVGKFSYVDYTLGLPSSSTLLNALKKDQIYVIAILKDSKGEVINAAKALVTHDELIDPENPGGEPVDVAGVTLDKHTVSLHVGATQSLVVTVSPENATEKSVTWTSDKPEIATVSENGVITGVKTGSATITVSSVSNPEIKDECEVTVTQPAKTIELNETSLTMQKQETKQLTATVKPDDTTDKTVTWSSSDSEIAEVDANGLVTAKKGGECTITATAASNTSVKAICEVKVLQAVTGVTLSETSIELKKIGETKQLTAKVEPEDATNKSVKWTSNDTGVCSVSEDGIVKAVGYGVATVVVSTIDGDFSASCEVTVAQYVTVTAKNTTREYGEANPTFEYEVSGGELSGTPELTCEATAESPVGTYDIVVEQGSVQNEKVLYVNGTLTVAKAPLQVKAKDAVRVEGEDNPQFEIVYNGWKLQDTESVLTEKPVVTTTATKESPAGEYDLVVGGGEAQNYELNYQNGKLTVTTADAINEQLQSEKKIEVYDLTGRKVHHHATSTSDLPKGIYVIGGRKTVVY